MGKTLKNIHACSVGNFEDNTKKIPQWITANGGTYYKDVTKDVTHLIATKEAFKQNGPAVAEAKKLKTVKIVSYDWLAESLLSKYRTPRLVKEYLWTSILKTEKKKKQKEKAKPKKIQREEEPVEQAQTERDETVGNRTGGHPSQKKKGTKSKGTKASAKYNKKKRKRRSADPFDTKLRTLKAQTIAANHRTYDAEEMTYSATLVRPSNTAGNTRETIQLKVFETIKAPHTYATHVKFSRRGLSKTDFLAPLHSDLDTALVAFRGFFKARTGKEWNDRLDGKFPSPKSDKDGNTQPPHKGWFWFDTGPAESSLASLFHDGNI